MVVGLPPIWVTFTPFVTNTLYGWSSLRSHATRYLPDLRYVARTIYRWLPFGLFVALYPHDSTFVAIMTLPSLLPIATPLR